MSSDRSVASPRDQSLDLLNLFRFQTEIEDVEVQPHVAGVGGAGQGHHADLEREPEDDLGDGPAVTRGDPGQLMAQIAHVVVGFIWAWGITWLIFSAAKKFIAVRVSPEVELQGLDMPEFGVVCYPDFQLV